MRTATGPSAAISPAGRIVWLMLKASQASQCGMLDDAAEFERKAYALQDALLGKKP